MTAIAFSGTFSATQSGSYTPVSLTEVLDTDNFHDNAVNPTRAVIPFTGWYLLWGIANGPDGRMYVQFKIDGTTAYGVNGQSQNGGNNGTTALHVMKLFAGQYVELEQANQDTTNVASGVLIITRLPTPMFVSSGYSVFPAPANLTFSPLLDASGWFDGAQPTRLTVDQAGNYLIMTQAVDGSHDQYYSEVRVNGTAVLRAYNTKSTYTFNAATGGPTSISVHTLNAGDYVEYYTNEPTTMTTFAMARLGSVRAAMGTQATPQTEPSYGSQPLQINLDAETVDTTAFHSTSVNNGRVTIPSGNAGKYLTFAANTLASTCVGVLSKNGTGIVGSSRNGKLTLGFSNGGGVSPTMAWAEDLSVGDYFTAQHYCVPGFNTDILGTYIGVVCLDDFVYEEDFIPQIYRFVTA